MQPETKDEIAIASWLIENGYAIKTNRKHILNVDIFHTTGEEISKPDLLIKTPITQKWYAIEVKTTNTTKNVLGGTKILNKYYKNYVEGKTRYTGSEGELLISGFLIATKFSKEGCIFKNETFEENEKWLIIRNIPQLEGIKSKMFLRQLWEQHKQTRNAATSSTPELGILISHKNTFKEKQSEKPLIFSMGSYYCYRNSQYQYGQRIVRE